LCFHIIPMRQMKCNFILMQDNARPLLGLSLTFLKKTTSKYYHILIKPANFIEYVRNTMRVEDYELWKDYQLNSNNWKQHYTEYDVKFLESKLEFVSICISIWLRNRPKVRQEKKTRKTKIHGFNSLLHGVMYMSHLFVHHLMTPKF